MRTEDSEIEKKTAKNTHQLICSAHNDKYTRENGEKRPENTICEHLLMCNNEPKAGVSQQRR